MLKIMLVQHTVCFHEARDWICKQDQSELTYQSLLSHCKLLESRCKQYQKTRQRGRADLMSISAVTASASSIHTDTLTTDAWLQYIQLYAAPNKCPTYGQQCYTCSGLNHYTALLWAEKQETQAVSQHSVMRSKQLLEKCKQEQRQMLQQVS